MVTYWRHDSVTVKQGLVVVSNLSFGDPTVLVGITEFYLERKC